ncbi:MAG: transporter substrate-binding domain-containing protein [Magnetococcales bacterium]|nr:transporter substrate-binding domain-containing protein [Magnetococcales bacterium]
MNKIFHGLLTVCCCVWMSAVATADPLECGKQPISLAIFKYGFALFDKDGQEQGFFKDLASELQRRSGCRFVPVVVAIARMWEDLANQQVDMLIAGRQSEERDRFAWFIPYLHTKDYALVHALVAQQVRSAEDFFNHKELRFGLLRERLHNQTQRAWVNRLADEGRVEESVNADILMEKLLKRRIDGFFMMPVVYRKIIQDLKVTNDIVVQDWFPDDPGYAAHLILAKARFSRAQVAQWDKLMQEMRQDGTLSTLLARYVPEEEAQWMATFRPTEIHIKE